MIPASAAAVSLMQMARAENEKVEETRTKISFPLRRRRQSADNVSSNDDDLLLLNCAARCMLQWCSLPIARAYAYGVYIDKETLIKLKSVSSEEITMLEKLLNGKTNDSTAFGEITLSLIMARDIPGAHMARGFQNSISNQLLRSGKNIQGISASNRNDSNRNEALSTGRAAALGKSTSSVTISTSSINDPVIDSSTNSISIKSKLERFAKAFEKIEDLKTGDEVSFTWRADGTVETRINNKPLLLAEDATLYDQTLARALFDVYLGKHSVSKEGHAFITNSLEYMVKNNVVAEREGSDKTHKTRVGTREDLRFVGEAVVHALRESPFYPFLPLSVTQRLENNDDEKRTGNGVKVSESGHLEGVLFGKSKKQ